MNKLIDIDCVLVMCTVPDAQLAEQLARTVVQQQLAACVTILSPGLSVYQWDGVLEKTTEIPLLIKTTHAGYDQLEAVIRMHHPYQVPEIIALPVCVGHLPYLTWVSQSVISTAVTQGVTADG